MLIAVDTGGTKTLVAAFRQDGTVAQSIKFPTPRDQSAYFEQLIGTISTIADGQEVEIISIALPGTIRDDIAVWCFNLKWRNLDVAAPLKSAFPSADVFIGNDANLAGLGETRMRDPMPRTSLYVTFSTGVGTGVVTDGLLNPGFLQSEGGHAIVEYKGQLLPWEQVASGRTIHQVFGKYGRDIKDEATWKDIADRMSRGLLTLIPFMQPDMVIVGGSMGTHFQHYGDFLIDTLKQQLHSEIQFPAIVSAKYPEEAVIYGCYYFALDEAARRTAA